LAKKKSTQDFCQRNISQVGDLCIAPVVNNFQLGLIRVCVICIGITKQAIPGIIPGVCISKKPATSGICITK